jgi:hypothetical protein
MPFRCRKLVCMGALLFPRGFSRALFTLCRRPALQGVLRKFLLWENSYSGKDSLRIAESNYQAERRIVATRALEMAMILSRKRT